MEVPVQPDVIRFDAYEVWLPTQELFKDGIRIKLAPQAFQILRILLEQRGQLVSREQLQKALWSADTFVDFNHGLNNAIKRIRDVLNDSAESPKYIETLPRLGYRFTGKLNEVTSISTPTVSPVGNISTDRAQSRHFIWLVVLAVGVTIPLVGISLLKWKGLWPRREMDPQIRSLAVLPIENLSGDASQNYLADGMTEALITEMGKISSPRVISRQSVMQYKSSKKSLPQIASELNVDAILEGAVKRSADRVRLTVRLSEARTERQLWVKEYDRNVRDVLEMQDEIARAVVDGIRVKLTPLERAGLSGTRPVDPQSQDDYLQGRYFSNRRTEVDTQTAIDYYNKAVAKDPGNALPYAGLAQAYFALANPWMPGHSPKQALPLARAAAIRALQLDPSLADAHVALGWSSFLEWKWLEAEKEARLAISLNPSNADAHELYSAYLSVAGHHEGAVAEMRDAIQSDPLNPDHRHELGWTLYRARQYDDAIRQFENLGDNPGLGTVYMAQKRYTDVIAVMEKDIRQSGRRPVNLGQLAEAYGYAGNKNRALELIRELKEISRRTYLSPVVFATPYLGLGQPDRALAWIERGYQDHEEWAVFYNTAPAFDPLRAEPRFQAVLKRMNFPR